MHVDERSLSIELYIDVGLELQDQINRTREAFKQSAEARAQASLLGHGTAALLAKQGLQKRDIGVLLGVSPGKAAKLLDTYHGGSAD